MSDVVRGEAGGLEAWRGQGSAEQTCFARQGRWSRECRAGGQMGLDTGVADRGACGRVVQGVRRGAAGEHGRNFLRVGWENRIWRTARGSWGEQRHWPGCRMCVQCCAGMGGAGVTHRVAGGVLAVQDQRNRAFSSRNGTCCGAGARARGRAGRVQGGNRRGQGQARGRPLAGQRQHTCTWQQKEKASQQHSVFRCGHPSSYYLSPTALNFGDRTRTGAFAVV